MSSTKASTHVEHRSTRTTKSESHREKDSHRDNREEKSSTHTHSAISNGSSTDRAFKDKHHPLLIAIWNTDRTQANVDEKLKGLRDLIKKGTSIAKCSKQLSSLSHTAFFFEDPSISCEILHEQTGTPIAQVSPLIIACFEGDVDIIRFFIEV
ncbi:unnamed protein product, partial [Adineta ricciae]